MNCKSEKLNGYIKTNYDYCSAGTYLRYLSDDKSYRIVINENDDHISVVCHQSGLCYNLIFQVDNSECYFSFESDDLLYEKIFLKSDLVHGFQLDIINSNGRIKIKDSMAKHFIRVYNDLCSVTLQSLIISFGIELKKLSMHVSDFGFINFD